MTQLTSEISLTLARRIGASAAQLFAAWTEPALMARWLAPAPYRVDAVEADARLGGVIESSLAIASDNT